MPSTMDRGQYPSIGSIFDLFKLLLNTNVNPLVTQIFFIELFYGSSREVASMRENPS